MKKIICMIMSVLMVFSLAACGNNSTPTTEPENNSTVNQPNNDDNTTVTPDNNGGENVPEDSQPVDEIEGFTYAEELAVALISQTGATAPAATTRLNLADVSSIKDATGLEDVSKIKNISVTESVDATKVFKIVLVIFNDAAAATGSIETLKANMATLGDTCVSTSVKNYAIAVVMNAGDSDTVTAQGICDKFVSMMEDEANIYFPTRHLNEEPPVDEPAVEDNNEEVVEEAPPTEDANEVEDNTNTNSDEDTNAEG